MKTSNLSALLFACALAVPSFAQQKTYNWVASNDETVSLDPGYYHGGPTFPVSAKVPDVHVDVDAQQPVTISMVSAQDWSDAAQHPEAAKSLTYVCTQEHVVNATYRCTPPAGLPMVIVVRDERVAERGSFFGIGEVISRHDRAGRDAELAGELGSAMAGHRMREFLAPNNVRLRYYDWACTDNCSLPDPPQPKLFDWVRADSETVRLDPANYYTSHTYRPGSQGGNMQVDIEAQHPVTIAMVDPSQWTDATERPSTVRNLNNIAYSCVQQHTVQGRYSCHMGGFWPQVLVIRDERDAGHDDHDANHGQSKNATTPNGTPQVVSVNAAGATLSNGNPGRQFASPNDVRIQYYSWRCVQACDQPDFGWVQQIKEKYELTKVLKLYGGLAADHDGTQVSIKVKSPVPMVVAVLPSAVAGQLYGKPDMFESAVAGSSCQQRGVQSSTFQCTFNVADGAQSLVLMPEAGVAIPNHKKAEVEVQSVRCIDNCANLPAK
jgi:hypothetical protein